MPTSSRPAPACITRQWQKTEGMKARRPARGSHRPGTFWYYNNWDFNALGTIFEQASGTHIYTEFKRRIAEPLQMQDYGITDFG